MTASRWEYLTLKAFTDWGLVQGQNLDAEKVNENLNRVGEEGWELVSCLDINTAQGRSNEVVFFFKRPAP